MIIKFKFKQYDEILEEHNVLFDYAEPQTTNEQDGTILVTRGARIVFPQLHVSFREAGWYTRNKKIEDPNDVDAWEGQDSVYALYDENEKDVNKYISFVTGSSDCSVIDACEYAGFPPENYKELDCYIDTSEFIDEKTLKRVIKDNWKEEVVAKYPEFFQAIQGHTYRLIRNSNYDYDVEVIITNESSSIEAYLGKTYYYEYCEWFVHNSSKDPDQNVAYQELIHFVKRIINNEVFGVICFTNGRLVGTALYELSELLHLTTESVFDDFMKRYPSLCEERKRILLRWCFWEGREDYDEMFYSPEVSG